MKSMLLTVGLLVVLGSAQASTTQASTSLGLSQGLNRQNLVMALNTTSPESTPNRSQLPLAAVPATEARNNDGAGFELESGLLLTLAGVMALLIISRRRMPR